MTRAKQIGIVTLLVHCSIVFVLICHHLATFRLKPERPMIVKVVAARPPPPQQVYVEQKPKKAPTVVAASKPVSAKPKAVTKAPVAAVLPKSAKPALVLPPKIEPKAHTVSEQDATYAERLIAYVQMVLDLPEYGEVRAKIEINPQGKLTSCEILEAKSEKNAEILKNQLPELTFPCLNDTQTFTITFRNVEIR